LIVFVAYCVIVLYVCQILLLLSVAIACFGDINFI